MSHEVYSEWPLHVINIIKDCHILKSLGKMVGQSKAPRYNEIVYKIAFSLYSSLLSIRYFEMGSLISSYSIVPWNLWVNVFPC